MLWPEAYLWLLMILLAPNSDNAGLGFQAWHDLIVSEIEFLYGPGHQPQRGRDLGRLVRDTSSSNFACGQHMLQACDGQGFPKPPNTTIEHAKL